MTSTTCRVAVVAALGLAAAGCGSKSSNPLPPSFDPTGRAAAPTSRSASAEQVAAESRGDVSCPAENKSAPRAANAPVDDVVGVRPGMLYAEAVNFVLCTNPLIIATPDTSRGVPLQTFGQKVRQGFEARFAEARVEKSSKQIMQEMQDSAIGRSGNRVVQDMKAGQAKWYVGTMGVPGQERVINVAREEWFKAGKNPTSASIEEALVAKYGQPTRAQKAAGRIYLTWVYDPKAEPVTETSPLHNRCSGSADPNGGANFSSDCGTVIAAVIYPLPDNPDLSQNFQVGVVNQAGGFEAITATEKALREADAARRAGQVQEATQNAAKPQL